MGGYGGEIRTLVNHASVWCAWAMVRHVLVGADGIVFVRGSGNVVYALTRVRGVWFRPAAVTVPEKRACALICSRPPRTA